MCWERKTQTTAAPFIRCRNNDTISFYQNQAYGDDAIVFIQKGYFIFTRKVL